MAAEGVRQGAAGLAGVAVDREVDVAGRASKQRVAQEAALRVGDDAALGEEGRELR